MNKIKNISTLIFDLGGVLVDLDWNRCVEEFKKLGVNEVAKYLSTTIDTGFILDYECGKISTEELRENIRSFSNQKLDDRQIDDAWASLLIGIPQAKLDLLLELKKTYRIVMLSNINPLSFKVCNEMFNNGDKNIYDYFDKLYLSYKMKMCKPNKNIFLQLLKEEDANGSECLFLDDSPINVNTAKEVGINSRLIEPFQKLDLKDFIQQ